MSVHIYTCIKNLQTYLCGRSFDTKDGPGEMTLIFLVSPEIGSDITELKNISLIGGRYKYINF